MILLLLDWIPGKHHLFSSCSRKCAESSGQLITWGKGTHVKAVTQFETSNCLWQRCSLFQREKKVGFSLQESLVCSLRTGSPLDVLSWAYYDDGLPPLLVFQAVFQVYCPSFKHSLIFLCNSHHEGSLHSHVWGGSGMTLVSLNSLTEWERKPLPREVLVFKTDKFVSQDSSITLLWPKGKKKTSWRRTRGNTFLKTWDQLSLCVRDYLAPSLA